MLGRVLTNFVSAYQRDRVHRGAMFSGELQRLAADFNGLLPKGEAIVRAVWQTDDVSAGHMSEPLIEGRRVSVKVRAQYAGACRIRVTVTTDAGTEAVAWHVVKVRCAPYLQGDVWVTGPTRLEIEA